MSGLGHEAFFAWTWMAAAFSPSSKAMRPAPNVDRSRRTQKKNDIKSEKVVTKTKSHFLAKPRELEGF